MQSPRVNFPERAKLRCMVALDCIIPPDSLGSLTEFPSRHAGAEGRPVGDQLNFRLANPRSCSHPEDPKESPMARQNLSI